MYTILVADDEPIMLNMVEKLLRKEGHRVIKANSAGAVYRAIEDDTPDLFLLDINLPDANGINLCKKLRQNPQVADAPIVFLTGAASSPDDVAQALDAGADDYIHKPFAARELMARVRAQLRRLQVQRDNDMSSLRLDLDAHKAFIDGEEIDLTRVEFNLLHFMSLHANEWHTTRQLLEKVWNYPGNVGDAALVRNHVRNLRLKLEKDASRPSVLMSRHRRGYMIRARVQIDGDASKHVFVTDL